MESQTFFVYSSEHNMSVLLQRCETGCHPRSRPLCPWAAWPPTSQPESPWWGGWHPEENARWRWGDAWECFSPPVGLRWREKVRVSETEKRSYLRIKQHLSKTEKQSVVHEACARHYVCVPTVKIAHMAYFTTSFGAVMVLCLFSWVVTCYHRRLTGCRLNPPWYAVSVAFLFCSASSSSCFFFLRWERLRSYTWIIVSWKTTFSIYLLVSEVRKVLQCYLCQQLLQLRVHVARLYEIHLFLQLPVKTYRRSTAGLKVKKISRSWNISTCCSFGCTCTGLVFLEWSFSVPLSSRWSACEQWHLRWFPPPRPSHHAYVCPKRRNTGLDHLEKSQTTHHYNSTCTVDVCYTDLGASVASSSSEYCEAQC